MEQEQQQNNIFCTLSNFLKNNLRHIVVFLIAIILLCFALLYLAGAALFGPSLCDSHWKPGMTDAEKIRAALTYSNKLSSRRFIFERPDGSISYHLSKQVPYKDADEILALYPDCCGVYSDNKFLDTEQRIAKNPQEEGAVYMEYHSKYKDLQGNTHPATVSGYVSFSTCR